MTNVPLVSPPNPPRTKSHVDPRDRLARCGNVRIRFAAAAICALAILITMSIPQANSAEPDRVGVEYANVDELPLLLDLYLPNPRADQGDKPTPLVVWVHGGAWRAGSRRNVPIAGLVDSGFAVASVDYRLSSQAAFPAQVHDIKAAIRWLRSESKNFGFNPDQIVIAGASAGGHLAALVGVTLGDPELEGSVGDHGDVSSHVAAIASFYGAANLETILDQSTPHGLSVRIPSLQLLLRAQPSQDPVIAKLASPVTHVDANDPPLLLIHGDQDPQMPINQSHELQGAYEQAGALVHFDVVHGGAHGGDVFYQPGRLNRVAEFFLKSLNP